MERPIDKQDATKAVSPSARSPWRRSRVPEDNRVQAAESDPAFAPPRLRWRGDLQTASRRVEGGAVDDADVNGLACARNLEYQSAVEQAQSDEPRFRSVQETAP